MTSPLSQLPTVQFASFAYADGVELDDPAESFHEAAKLYPSMAGRQTRGIALADDPAVAGSMVRSSRRQPHRPRTLLPARRRSTALLEDALDARRSRCPSGRTTLELTDLATLLSAYEADESLRRRTPSGGALY
ncbi:MAG: hypothetical protein ACXWZB_05155, partial [Gaiellaceae bacterium]